MHYQIRPNTHSQIFQVGYRQYFVFLVSSLETFFRDTFVFLVSSDEGVINKLVNYLKVKQKDISKLESNAEIAEFLSKCFNFQNFNDINIAFTIILGEDFWNYIQNYKIEECAIKNKIRCFSLTESFVDWQDVLMRSLRMRHKIIHDANYRPLKDISLIKKAEAIVLILPQIITHSFSKRFNLEYTELSFGDGISYPYLFSVDDVLSEDWEISGESEPGLRHATHKPRE